MKLTIHLYEIYLYMNLKNFSKLFILLFVVAAIISCSKNSRTSVSNTTGWKYNDEKATGFVVKDDYKSKVPTGMLPIEGGTFTIGEKGEVITAPRNNLRRRITVSSFYMDEYEISNVNWREYTNWMQVVFGKTAPTLVEKARPNGEVWREALAYNEPYLENYFYHPAYDNYPVVGVTWEQAMDYCAWRTDRVNELALINAGVIAAPDFSSLKNQSNLDSIANNFVFNTKKYLYQKNYNPATGKKALKDLYGQARKSDMADGILFSDYRLPTEAEWEFAAYAIKSDKRDGLVEQGRIYPWNGNQLRNPKRGKFLGEMQANFVRGRGDMMGTSGSLNDNAVITAPVNSYSPNNFGLYNMAGNVNEWVLDVYRSETYNDVAEYNSFRGNAYQTAIATSKDDVGNYVLKIDSLGRVVTAVKPGDDMRSFHDGDETTQLNTDFQMFTDPEGMEALRNQEKLDPTDILAPKITDKTRVYKGGSWKDRAYWLNPSTRRYLDQDKCTNDIGFRCAMSMIGDIKSQSAKMK
ncbi:conserved hypothetical protein [uncultured Paludibacter sp.]|uniref:Sulfatase-modifying factor enzyme-like domain-containing protein n=1 Tax=uncultured Paludibacter sp. TaxID=497635 RepID=A0A653AHI9_9BACT|nr:conserved hypothetical protein [uncultured Paludibacter sp.]